MLSITELKLNGEKIVKIWELEYVSKRNALFPCLQGIRMRRNRKQMYDHIKEDISVGEKNFTDLFFLFKKDLNSKMNC